MERMLGFLLILFMLAVGFSLLNGPDPMQVCEDNGYSTSTCFQQLNR